jgi:hypothetical protein
MTCRQSFKRTYSHGDKGEDSRTNPAGSVGVEIQKTDCEAAEDHSKVEP